MAFSPQSGDRIVSGRGGGEFQKHTSEGLRQPAGVPVWALSLVEQFRPEPRSDLIGEMGRLTQ